MAFDKNIHDNGKIAMALIALCHVRSWDETHSERVIVCLFILSPVYTIIIPILREVIEKSKKKETGYSLF